MIDIMKSKILAFLPVMKELEKAGYNPVKIMFSKTLLTIDEIEAVYKALTACKIKYPEWYSVMARGIPAL
ncbi:hypothetical protein LCGC14_0661590 [marine sediment metagenome]|uniref:Uncharacterized protein n=1 Tax=marine sediment metagenome TaxID=412755 RepID=A0A0F9TEW3_9ZZZZ